MSLNKGIVAHLVLAFCLVSYAHSVTVIKPAKNSSQIHPVEFEMELHARADSSTLEWELLGLQSQFGPPPSQGSDTTLTHTALYLEPGDYTLRVHANFTSSRPFDVLGFDWPFSVPERWFAFSYPGILAPGSQPLFVVHTGGGSSTGSGGAVAIGSTDLRVPQTQSVVAAVWVPSAPATTLPVELILGNNINIDGQAADASVVVNIPNSVRWKEFTIQDVQVGATSITARSQARGYHDTVLTLQVIP